MEAYLRDYLALSKKLLSPADYGALKRAMAARRDANASVENEQLHLVHEFALVWRGYPFARVKMMLDMAEMLTERGALYLLRDVALRFLEEASPSNPHRDEHTSFELSVAETMTHMSDYGPPNSGTRCAADPRSWRASLTSASAAKAASDTLGSAHMRSDVAGASFVQKALSALEGSSTVRIQSRTCSDMPRGSTSPRATAGDIAVLFRTPERVTK